MTDLIEWASDTARRWLDVPEFRGRRWLHVQAVGAKAQTLSPAYGAEGNLLVAAAWLHDIGYSVELQRTGFHPIDGAAHLELEGADQRLVSLVANHSGAAQEASLRGLREKMLLYPDERTAVRDALWACDMTTGPDGAFIGFDERISEIVDRYGRDHTVPRALIASSIEIRATIARTNAFAQSAGISVDL